MARSRARLLHNEGPNSHKLHKTIQAFSTTSFSRWNEAERDYYIMNIGNFHDILKVLESLNMAPELSIGFNQPPKLFFGVKTHHHACYQVWFNQPLSFILLSYICQFL
jgi:hypothetical protein